ncbi:hypothetical protein GCM10011391_21480 [Pullulanibacillus camelliae]|uniref:Uncharacterized protein n=1 Tax=Pullulanibacillus camelliae TaxID=1707096 RepID=A0A8J2W3S5_9BACL|nr:hypothetical protein GCM10011391_21480 [Pullulanibacillus camelliae]
MIAASVPAELNIKYVTNTLYSQQYNPSRNEEFSYFDKKTHSLTSQKAIYYNQKELEQP